MKIAVLHPDLGIGGAERLIVDATCALINEGYETEVYTGYYDERRCFEETRQFNIIVLGEWIPRSICGRLHAVLAYLKMMYIAIYLVIHRRNLNLILCDQVSACIPILRVGLKRTQIIFYCHFPDQLLTTRDTFLKAIYRKPLDTLEEWSTGLADHIIVNSQFTSSVVRKTFKSLKSRDLEVLYPCVKITQPLDLDSKLFSGVVGDLKSKLYKHKPEDRYVFLSLNRFEKKKNISLAIEALSICATRNNSNKGGQLVKAHLIVAGGYDERLRESVKYFDELKHLVDQLDLKSQVTFVKSPDDCEKECLIQICDAVLYTPENEHFGIVPLEAMVMRRPVVASASGGPLETVQNGVTGILCESNKEAFADAMHDLISNPKKGIDMGEAGFRRVQKSFSFEAFSKELNRICSCI